MDESETKCEVCGRRRAKIHLTDFVDGKAVQKHVCEQCYKKHGGLPELDTPSIFQQLIEAVAPQLRELSSKRCPECGTNYLEFRQAMKLGCPNDYEVFGDAMEQLTKRLHNATRHTGKVPLNVDAKVARQKRLQHLKQQMRQAIEKEDYERAALLRDKIRELAEG